jgi:hypothetical protein
MSILIAWAHDGVKLCCGTGNVRWRVLLHVKAVVCSTCPHTLSYIAKVIAPLFPLAGSYDASVLWRVAAVCVSR